MSKRTVFGRRRFECGGTKWKVELKEDGLYLRQHKTKRQWRVPLQWLLHFCKQQLEIFDEGMDTSDQGTTMPGVQKTIVVSDWGNADPVHANPQPAKQDPQVGGDGLAALIGRAEADAARKGLDRPPPIGELPGADGPVDGPHDKGTV